MGLEVGKERVRSEKEQEEKGTIFETLLNIVQ